MKASRLLFLLLALACVTAPPRALAQIECFSDILYDPPTGEVTGHGSTNIYVRTDVYTAIAYISLEGNGFYDSMTVYAEFRSSGADGFLSLNAFDWGYGSYFVRTDHYIGVNGCDEWEVDGAGYYGIGDWFYIALDDPLEHPRPCPELIDEYDVGTTQDQVGPPTVTISGPMGVVNGNSGTYTIKVENNTYGESITITISHTGDGRATFDGGAVSKTINQTTDVTVHGSTTSSTANDLTITANDPYNTTLATKQLTIIWVTISSIYTDGPLQGDDDAKNQYLNSVGTSCLGHCAGPAFDGVEIKGTVQPTNFTDVIKLKQTKVSYAQYGDATNGHSLLSSYTCNSGDYTTCVVDDSGGGANQDITPAPSGNIYTWDAPGVGLESITGSPRVTRIRQNFATFAIYGSGGTLASNVFTWFNANSAKRDGDGLVSYEATYNFRGDNTAGQGTTKTTWDLQ